MDAAQPKHPAGRQRVGLALGAGGARGWAHLGVLRRLTDLGVPIDCVAGTSAGALVGAVYLTGQLDLLEDLSRHLDWRQTAKLFFEVNFPRSGLLTGRNIMHLLQELIPVDKIEALKRPFAAVATDLDANREVVFTQGSLSNAIRASISIPGIFTPVRSNSRNLVDGALVNPLPVSVLRETGADRVIAVDVNLRSGMGEAVPKDTATSQRPSVTPPKAMAELVDRIRERLPDLSQQTARVNALVRKWKHRSGELSIFEVLTQATRIFENQITRSRLLTDPPDILIQPAVGDIATLDFTRGPQAIAAGCRAVDEKLPEIKSLLEGLTSPLS
jgi:NTE family protein